jgi:hypothetical protein
MLRNLRSVGCHCTRYDSPRIAQASMSRARYAHISLPGLSRLLVIVELHQRGVRCLVEQAAQVTAADSSEVDVRWDGRQLRGQISINLKPCGRLQIDHTKGAGVDLAENLNQTPPFDGYLP